MAAAAMAAAALAAAAKPQRGTGGTKKRKKKPISPFGDASGKKIIDATISIGPEIQCLLCAEFF